MFGRTTTKWSNRRCPFHVGGSVRIRSNNGGREFRDLLSPFRDETSIRRERGSERIELERNIYIFVSDRFSFFFLDILSRGTLINPLRHSPRNGLNSEQFVSATCILMLISDVREEDLLTLRCFRRVPLPLLIPFQRPPAPLEFHHFDVIIRLAVSISPRPNT